MKLSILHLLFLTLFVAHLSDRLFAQSEDESAREVLIKQAAEMRRLVVTPNGKSFLSAVKDLPQIDPRIIYYNKSKRKALSEIEAAQLDQEALKDFERMKLDERFYYFTKYGTPLAYARALDMVGQVGLQTRNAKILDFGFGGIGHLRLLASQGADVTGIEVDPLLKALYSSPGDTGSIESGKLRLLFGSFPSDAELAKQVGGDFDLILSKNVLKRGYIHPEREADPKRLIKLGVDDETFVREIYERLKPGGFFMIYNLHPRQAAASEPYIPWADGRSPFSQKMLENTGFKVVTFDGDDTSFARRMGKALGWQSQMELKDLFATYTLVRK